MKRNFVMALSVVATLWCGQRVFTTDMGKRYFVADFLGYPERFWIIENELSTEGNPQVYALDNDGGYLGVWQVDCKTWTRLAKKKKARHK